MAYLGTTKAEAKAIALENARIRAQIVAEQALLKTNSKPKTNTVLIASVGVTILGLGLLILRK